MRVQKSFGHIIVVNMYKAFRLVQVHKVWGLCCSFPIIQNNDEHWNKVEHLVTYTKGQSMALRFDHWATYYILINVESPKKWVDQV